MKKGDPEDGQGTDRTTVASPAPGFHQPVPTYEGSLQALEEATMQGASFLVERITPVPPQRTGHSAALAPRPAPFVSDSAKRSEVPFVSDSAKRSEVPFADGASLDAPTAAVLNPSLRAQPAQPPEPRTAALRIDPASLPRMDPAMAPISRLPSGDAPPEMDTAYVPLPSPPQAQNAGMSGRATVIAAKQMKPPGMVDKIMGSKNGRLGLIGGCGMLGIALVLVLFWPKKPTNLPPPTAITADPGPTAQTKPPPPKEPEENLDPAKVKEKDALLERAILAFESGKTEEALALFRRYGEEDSSQAAEFMVQLLQNQQSQTDKDR